MVHKAGERVEREAAALPARYDGAEPVSAETPQWPEGSLGHRFLTGTYLGEALLDGAVPGLDAQVATDARIGHPAATRWRPSSPPGSCRPATSFR
jgi:hypothetical protein